MKIEIVRPRQAEGAEAALASAYEEMARWLQGHVAFSGWPEATVRIVLGGEEEARLWKVRPDALGFHAVAATDHDEESGEDWIDVNEHHEVHLNLEAGARELQRRWPSLSGIERECEMEAMLTTAPHELLHLVDWLREAEGRTPIEVFDQDDGEDSIREILARTDADGTGEDRTEAAAREIALQFCSGRIGRLAEAFADARSDALADDPDGKEDEDDDALEAERIAAPRL